MKACKPQRIKLHRETVRILSSADARGFHIGFITCPTEIGPRCAGTPSCFQVCPPMP
jgi:hypothetical protein